MSKPAKPAPKHRAPAPAKSALRSPLRTAVVATGVAAAATGVSVAAGVAQPNSVTTSAAIDLSAASDSNRVTVDDLVQRETAYSRSSDDRRAEQDPAKTVALSEKAGVAKTKVERINSSDPRELAKALMPQAGLSAAEFSCLDRIWTQESNWQVDADNPTSSAYGIPQALPGSKMASAGADWATNPETQIKWGLGYIKDRYGTACSAWDFKAVHGWY